MVAKGSSTFDKDEQGRVLDRLAGLEKLITPEIMRQVLRETNRVNTRACKLTHEVMLRVVLAMGILTHLPIRQVFKHARRFRMDEQTPHRSSLRVARQRLGIAPIRRLFLEVVRPLANPDTPGAFHNGLRLMGIDGTILNVPDMPANDNVFGRPSGGRGDGAFPQVRKVSLVELGTHAEVAIQIKPCTSSEQAALPSLLRHLTPEMLLIVDRDFFGYPLWKTLNSRGIKVLARVKSNLILEPIEHLADGSYLAKVYPTFYARQKDRDGIVVRVIKYRLDDPRRATKPAHLRSETPVGVIQEIYALSLAHFVIRSMMFEAAEREGLDPDRLSFTGCFQILQSSRPDQGA